MISVPRRKTFLDRVAVDNPIANYFEVSFSRDTTVSRELMLKGQKDPVQLIDLKPQIKDSEVTLFARPYLRCLNGRFDAKVSFRFDLECGFQSTPEERTIIKNVPAGYLVVRDMEDEKIFRPLEQLQDSWPAVPINSSWYFRARPCWARKSPSFSDNTVLGVFGPRESFVTGWMTEVICTDDCRIEVGILAAVYAFGVNPIGVLS